MTTAPSTLRGNEWERIQSIAIESSAIMVTDSSGIIVWVNNTFSKMTGYSAEEAIGKTPKLLKSGKQELVIL